VGTDDDGGTSAVPPPPGTCDPPSPTLVPYAVPDPPATTTWDDIASDTGVNVERLLVANNIDPTSSPIPPPTPGATIGIPPGLRNVSIAPETTNTAAPTACTALITSSNITVGGVPFVAWFNKNVRGTHGSIFGNPINPAGFTTAWNNVQALTSKSGVVLNEFVGHLMIMYNETGGKLAPSPEGGDAPYFFESRLCHYADGTPFQKGSYNGTVGNRLAGNQLSNGTLLPAAKLPALQPLIFSTPIITTQQDVQAWNGPSYPSSASAAVQQAAQECDFYKYRGRGLNQLTFWTNYKRFAGPSIQRVLGTTVDAMKSSELDTAMMNPVIYLDAFRLYNLARGGSVSKLIQGSFADYGSAVAGSPSYGSGLYTNRCVALAATMLKGGVTASA
jgi:hypothetical protein